MIIGLTGGIGSGKSTVSGQLAGYDIEIIDADVIARQLVEPNNPALREIVEAFGEALLNNDGTLNRPALRAIIFQNDEARQRLNQIMHPRIRQALVLTLNAPNSQPYRVLSAPLLIENKLLEYVDAVAVVDLPEALQIQRVIGRDGGAIETVQKIMMAQCSRSQRLQIANYVIDNSKDFQDTKIQTEALHRHFMEINGA